MSYLIKNEKLIAITNEQLKSGAVVKVGHRTVKEAINADREESLVNSFSATISNAKKWGRKAEFCHVSAIAINNSDNEFLLM